MYKRISGIYCIENNISHKKYIGQSISIYYRWYKHRRELNNGSHDNDYLQKSWNKYGESNFNFYILEECEKDDLDAREIYYIKLYDTLNRDFGYNLKAGGQNGGCQVLEEVRERQSLALKQSYKSNKDLIDLRKNDALKQWSNPEIKAKILGENNGMYGKHHTDEAKKKMSEAKKGTISMHRNTTPVLCVETGKIFDCAIIAMRELGITTSILQVCYGNRKTAGGYHWQFIMEK